MISQTSDQNMTLDILPAPTCITVVVSCCRLSIMLSMVFMLLICKRAGKRFNNTLGYRYISRSVTLESTTVLCLALA